MSATQKSRVKSGSAAGSVKKVARRVVKKAAKRTESALAVVAHRIPSASRVKHVGATLKSVPSRAKRFIKSNPVRVVLGASAIGFVLAKLKHLV